MMDDNNRSAKNLIMQARKEILINKNCQKALIILANIDESKILDFSERLIFKKIFALTYLENSEYKKAAEIYKEINEKYQAGFCELLTGNEKEAENLWHSKPATEPCLWGRCLLDFINLRKGQTPSYLQIRNHLEIDMGYFIQANKLKYAENLMKNEDVFISVNLESHKFIGKVLLNYGFFNMAKKYFLKSLNVIPSDAETLYFLGQYNYLTGAYKESQKALERCLENNYYYIPARKLLGKIELKLNNTIW